MGAGSSAAPVSSQGVPTCSSRGLQSSGKPALSVQQSNAMPVTTQGAGGQQLEKMFESLWLHFSKGRETMGFEEMRELSLAAHSETTDFDQHTFALLCTVAGTTPELGINHDQLRRKYALAGDQHIVTDFDATLGSKQPLQDFADELDNSHLESQLKSLLARCTELADAPRLKLLENEIADLAKENEHLRQELGFSEMPPADVTPVRKENFSFGSPTRHAHPPFSGGRVLFPEQRGGLGNPGGGYPEQMMLFPRNNAARSESRGSSVSGVTNDRRQQRRQRTPRPEVRRVQPSSLHSQVATLEGLASLLGSLDKPNNAVRKGAPSNARAGSTPRQ